MRIRQQGDYKAFFTDSYKTLRLTKGKPTTPELLDISLGSACGAFCKYCYTSALKNGTLYDNIVEKAIDIWGNMELNDRPFQIAIGGGGEPTLHHDFISFIKEVRSLGIIPNYTTNGMHLTEEILKATEEYCGGVALSWHPHIKAIFHKAIKQLSSINTKLNVHVILGTEQSLEDLKMLYAAYADIIDYFVILPYQPVGRAEEIQNVEHVWEKTFNFIEESTDTTKFAFGALFYDYVKKTEPNLKMSIYDPDVYSGYKLLDDNYQKTYKSSYELIEK